MVERFQTVRSAQVLSTCIAKIEINAKRRNAHRAFLRFVNFIKRYLLTVRV